MTCSGFLERPSPPPPLSDSRVKSRARGSTNSGGCASTPIGITDSAKAISWSIWSVCRSSTRLALPCFASWRLAASVSQTVRHSSWSNSREWPMLAVNTRAADSAGLKDARSRANEQRAADGSAVDDCELLAALRAGHDWAFETMVRKYGGRLLAVARRFMRNEEDAQDVVQSAYLSAFRALEDFEGACQLPTWLHRIVVNTALMKLRARRRKPEESIETLLPTFQDDGHHVEQFSDWSAPADQLVERSETRATVRACIGRLPEGYRVVLMLRDIEELSTQEVAGMLNMTPTAVKVRLHRARQALFTLLRTDGALGAV